MKKLGSRIWGAVVGMSLAAMTPASTALAQKPAVPAAKGKAHGPFSLSSPDLVANGRITNAHVFNSFGCSGQNVSPTLSWKNAPADTKSFALTVYDPDAPTGSGWWHWMLYNIPASETGLKAGAGAAGSAAAPAGSVQGPTDFGTPGYGGPCPPAGDKPHRYIFTLHALKVAKLDIPANATSALVGFNIHGNEIAKTSFTARYGR